MSYGLVRSLSKILPSLDHIPALMLNDELRDKVLVALLSDRSNTGKVTKEADLDESDIAVEEVERVIAWAQEHLLDFFLRSAKNAQTLLGRQEKELTPSLTGTEV